MKGFDIINSTNAFKLEIVLFVLLIIFAISNIFNITLVPTNVFSDQSLGETKQQQPSEKAAEGGVESTTMKHIMTNSQQSFNSSTQQKTDLGSEAKNKNNWVTVNHDIYGTRSSNQ